jgi:hypothetical protein
MTRDDSAKALLNIDGQVYLVRLFRLQRDNFGLFLRQQTDK